MNNKDLLNEIIDQMNERGEQIKNINNDNVAENIDDNVDNQIQLALSTGETYLVDPNNFDWDRAVMNLAQITENEASFRNIQYTLILIAGHEDEDDAKDFIARTINNLTEYLAGYQIEVDYRKFNPDINDYQLAMMMLFDVNNITRTMSHQISLYSALSMLMPHKFDDNSGVEDYKAFRINAETTEGGITITSINETDDYEPDEVGIIDEPSEGNMTIVVYAKDLKDARANADAIFGLNSVNDEFDFDTSSSGLLDE